VQDDQIHEFCRVDTLVGSPVAAPVPFTLSRPVDPAIILPLTPPAVQPCDFQRAIDF
jgi:hypothetical protein